MNFLRSKLALRLRTPAAVALCGFFVVISAAGGSADSPGNAAPRASTVPLPTVAEKTAGLEARPGLLDLFVDSRAGTVWLALPPAGAGGVVGRYLYAEGLAQGLGSNPVGLDRGQLGTARLVALRRLGGRLLVEEENWRFRATSADPQEQRAVRESFATSVLWAGPVAAEDEDGRFLVDLSSFILRDAHDVQGKLRQTGQGSYALDGERSAVDPAGCLAFPDNLELEGLLTYGLSADAPGPEVAATAPLGRSVTLVQHHSLIRLPAPGFEPRTFHPESGLNPVRFQDYGAPLDAPLEKRWIERFRLRKLDPQAAVSGVEKPIVFYLDPGTPEPVRSTLLEGVGWWREAFRGAGFEDAFRVEMLPAGVHPLDVRYNVIQWVHRATRGWSYGGGLVDPRTGEIVKGFVTLGSLRVRQDRRIFEGLLGVEKTGSGQADDPVQLSLARLRQLAAHEVGHALGLAHNFAASTRDRASVMDYPAPWILPKEDGSLDASQAYAAGIGAWDAQAIRYGYGEPGQRPEQKQEEVEYLASVLAENRRLDLPFLTDEDARPAGAAQPWANLWDNGADPLAEWRQVLEVRRRALAGFGERNLAEGQPLALLEEVLAPIYFYHRYQLDAVAKIVGGLDYTYASRGDGRPPAVPLPPETQRQALAALLEILEPSRLDLPEELLAQLLPRPSGYAPHGELFQGATAPVFDPLSAAATAADQAVQALLRPQRAARLVDFHRRDGRQPSFEEVLQALITHVFTAPPQEPPRHQEIRRALRQGLVDRLIALASTEPASPAVRWRAEAALIGLSRRLITTLEGTAESETSQAAYLQATIDRFLMRPQGPAPPAAPPPEAPPGSPIGAASASDGPWDAGWAECSRGWR